MIEINSSGEAETVKLTDTTPTLPSTMPVLPLRDNVPLPDSLTPLAVGQERSIQLVNEVLTGNRLLVMVASREPEVEAPGPAQLYDVGVVGTVARMMKIPDGSVRILVQGQQRVRIDRFVRETPYLVAEISELPDLEETDTPELQALMRNVQQTFASIVDEVPYLPEELALAVANIDDPSQLTHLIAGSLRLKGDEKQQLLEELDVSKRLRHLVDILARESEVISINSKIQGEVQSEIDKGQREYILREQLKAIQAELGELNESQVEAQELREQLADVKLPEEVRKQVDRELQRVESMSPQAAEYGVIRNYLEWIASLPWDKETEDNLDLDHAREILDEDHYDIEQVKDRILEFLAVRQLTGESEAIAGGSILCLTGPPGVGKTSLGRSIARALGREFERISVGGVRDEAEIRGHRRTYIGALPGTIIRALRDAGSNNPLFMIDEIDKMGSDFRGDPSSAMLEVLDPEQNSTFRDHYLDVPFDLSNVMFVCTANDMDRIPGPLRDRMEVIELAGYSEDEKLEIAKRYLVGRQIERNGLKKAWVGVSDKALRAIISDYTREAGVRQLERVLGSVFRKIARELAPAIVKARSNGGYKPDEKIKVDPERVRELLGRPRFHSEAKQRTQVPGVATGLAWTPVGGDVLFIEASSYPGSGELVLTGSLGDVMKESARAALTWVRGHLDLVAPDLTDAWFAENDVHIHVPAGATPKDGPSAGITMATALSSLLSGRAIREEVAMTGEITLTGQVLPIGGLKEKSLAAQRNGITKIIAPALNEGDTEDIPEHLRNKIEFVFVQSIAEVLVQALEPAGAVGKVKA
ncbi:MAG TPA: endopeptidase La [Baekduia sp.]|nr:endopeptidase La [Baekduia sp.]